MGDNRFTILASGTFVRGDLFSEGTLVIEGGVEGNIVGARVIVKARGWVHGDVTCRALSIEPGGVVDGAVKVTTQPSLPPGQAQPESLPQTHQPPALDRPQQEAEHEDQQD